MTNSSICLWQRSASQLRFLLAVAFVTVAFVGGAGVAHATIATYTSESAWQSTVSSPTLINFDNLVSGTEVSNQYNGAGATFSRFNGGIPLASAETGPLSFPNLLSVDDASFGGGAGGGVAVDFASPQRGVALWYSDAQFAGSFVTIYDSANQILSTFEMEFPHPTVWQFVGFTSSGADIAKVDVAIAAGDRVPLDNVQFSTVPEPATWCLFAMGAIGLTAAMRRNRETVRVIASARARRVMQTPQQLGLVKRQSGDRSFCR